MNTNSTHPCSTNKYNCYSDTAVKSDFDHPQAGSSSSFWHCHSNNRFTSSASSAMDSAFMASFTHNLNNFNNCISSIAPMQSYHQHYNQYNYQPLTPPPNCNDHYFNSHNYDIKHVPTKSEGHLTPFGKYIWL